MHRTTNSRIDQITRRLAQDCLGDAEFCALQAQLEDLDPNATISAGGDELYLGEPPY